MRGIRSRLTYANVVSTVALFLVLTGGVAYAADTIFSADIVDGEVKAEDIATAAVRTQELGTNQIRSADVRDDTLAGGGLTGADIALNTLTSDRHRREHGPHQRHGRHRAQQGPRGRVR